MQQNGYEQRKEFFQTLFKGTKGYIEIRTIDRKGEVKQDWYKTSEIEELLKELEKPYFLKVNTYFGVCPRREKKGTEKDVSQVNCLWVDLDAKNREEKRAIRKKLDDFDPEPSIIVSSGNGYHCYWLFDKLEEINTQQDINRVKGYNKGLAEELKGDKGIDLSRILRVPGTKNLKNPKETLAVTIVKFEPQTRYSLKGQFLARFKRDISNLEIEKVELDQNIASNIPDRFWVILEENSKIASTWKGTRKDLKDKSRSGYDFALANLLMPFGFTDSELISILRESGSGKGREAKAQYLTVTIGKAKATWEKRRKEKEKRLDEDKERFESLSKEKPLKKKEKEKKPPPVSPGEEKTKYDLDKVILRTEEFLKVKTPKKETILSPWLKEKQIILISGWRGIGKTWLGLSLIDSITKGQPFCSWKVETPVNCLYLDAEMAKPDMNERLLILNPKQQRKAELSIYSSELANILGDPRPCLFDLTWQALFKDWLVKNKIKLWVADNITSLTPGLDENVKSEWDKVNQWLLELRFAGISTILIHHIGKLGTQRGTSAREDNIDISIMLNYPAGYQDTDGCKFDLHFTKTRLSMKELQGVTDLQLQLIEDEKGNPTWTYGSIKKSVRNQILVLLNEGITNQTDIAEQLNVSRQYISRTRKEAIRDKLITSEGKLTQTGLMETGKI